MEPYRQLCDLLGSKYPIQQAGMGEVAGVNLACAVYDAGGIGVVGYSPISHSYSVENLIKQLPERCFKRLGINFLIPFLPPKTYIAEASKYFRFVEFFYGDPDPELVDLIHKNGSYVLWQVGSYSEAKLAEACGVDGIIIQGTQAGGHIRGTETLSTLIDQSLENLNVALIASGGISSPGEVKKLLDMGLSGVRIGTAFVATNESRAHQIYKKALVSAVGSTTEITTAFSLGWHAPHRVLIDAVRALEAETKDNLGILQLDNTKITVPKGTPLPPTVDFEGNVKAMAMYAGLGVEAINTISNAKDVLEFYASYID
jgi:nitronate monooxygenase